MALLRYCASCDEQREFHSLIRTAFVSVGSKSVRAEVSMLRCVVCGDEQPDDRPGFDTMTPILEALKKPTR